MNPNYGNSSTPYSPRFNYILYIFILTILFDLLSPFTTDIYNPILPIIINDDNFHSTPFMIQLSHTVNVYLLFSKTHQIVKWLKIHFVCSVVSAHLDDILH